MVRRRVRVKGRCFRSGQKFNISFFLNGKKEHHLNIAFLKFDLHCLSQFNVTSKNVCENDPYKNHWIFNLVTKFSVIQHYFGHISSRKHNLPLKFHISYEKNMSFLVVSKSPIWFWGQKVIGSHTFKFIDPNIMGIDIKMMLMGTSLTN